MPIRHLALGAALSLWSATGMAADGQKLSLTIYNSDLALVQDTRDLTVGAGRQRIEFKDVSGQIRPETVSLTAAGLEIVEQNFDFDLLTPAKLMEKAVGQQVQIVRINPGSGAQQTETATVLSVNEGVVLKIGDRIEVLRQDDIPTRVIFDKIPENLRARPTLSVTVDSVRAGPRPATLSYLSRGLSWKADYVAMFDERAGRLDLQGWVTLTNNAGVDFRDAEVQLVAGEVNMAEGQPQPYYRPPPPPRGSVRSAGVQGTGQRSLADYYLYPLPARTTVAQNQTKQVSLLDVKAVSAHKVYEYRSQGFPSLEQPANADVAVQFANSGDGGLSRELPGGVVRVYVRDQAGDPKFLGENRLEHTPQGSDIAVKIGEAFDVTVQPILMSEDRLSSRKVRRKMSYLIRNARTQPATVVVRQTGVWGENRIIAESLKGRRTDAHGFTWDVPVPANGETTLVFTVETEG